MPDWFEKISPSALDIGAAVGSLKPNGRPACGCICAQLDALYLADHPRAASQRGARWFYSFRRIFGTQRIYEGKINAIDLGFTSGVFRMPDGDLVETTFRALTAAWRTEIKKRREAAKAA
jgi:hypothetical protein